MNLRYYSFITALVFCVVNANGAFMRSPGELYYIGNNLSNSSETVLDNQDHLEKTGLQEASCRCENGYCEKDAKGKLVCKCPPEYGLWGPKCLPCNCGKDSNCTISGFWSLTINCICKEGYKESNSTCKGSCSPNPCKNGGVCTLIEKEIKCKCPNQYLGELCKTSRCENKCGGSEGGVKCTGEQTTEENTICGCDVETSVYVHYDKKCIARCENKCGGSEGGVKCTGDQTTEENTICGCDVETSVYVHDDKKCIARCENKCGGSEGGVKCTGEQTTEETTICGCDVETSVYVHDDKKCIASCKCTGGYCEEDANGKLVCKCPPEFVLDGAKCKPCNCGKDSNCTFSGFWTVTTKCICKEGYKELNSTCKVKCTRDSECGEREICSENNVCECKAGLDGEDCQTVIGCEALKPTCDEAGLECIFDVKELHKSNCKCEKENYVFVKEEKVCKPKCNGDTDCGATGKCTAEMYCTCKEGYEGEGCKVVSGCKYLKTVCDAAGLECVFDGKVLGKANCKCQEENNIFLKEENGCKQSCQQTADCGERGKCTDKKFCICKDGYEGDGCKVITGCKVLEEKCKRANATCVFNKTAVNKASCQCEQQNHIYFEEQCKEIILDCGCQNGGTCLPGGRCSCLEGTGGSKCEHVDCDMIYPGCKDSGGKCEYSLERKIPFCYCPATKVFHNVSKRCEDFCQNNPCRNGGTCETYINTFFCRCKEKFVGKYCEKSWCTEICGNHSGVECDGDQTSYDRTICGCKDKNEIYVKEVKRCINACKSSPCQNGGTCSPDGTSFRCHCEMFVSGAACETDNRYMKIVFVGLVLVVLVIILLICISCCMLKIIQMLKRNSPNSEEWKSRPGVP